MKEATQEIINFLENPTPATQKEKGNMKMDLGSTSTCNLVLTENKEVSTARRLDMENIMFLGQRFRWKKDHPTLQNHVKSIFNIATEQKEDYEQLEFPESFTKNEEGERYLDEEKPLEWMEAKIKTK